MACRTDSRRAANTSGLPMLNIVLLGDFGVGKTSLIRRFKYDMYNESISQDTIGDFEDVICCVPLRDNCERWMTVRLHDTAGMEMDGVSLPSNYYRDKDGIVLTWDLTREETFRRLGGWEEAVLGHYREHNIPAFIVVANKAENHDQGIDSSAYQQCLEAFRLKKYSCFKTSARDAVNVKQAFNELISLMGRVYDEKSNHPLSQEENSPSVVLGHSEEHPGRGECCNK